MSFAADFAFHIECDNPCKEVKDFYARCLFCIVDSSSLVYSLPKISQKDPKETFVIRIAYDVFDKDYYNNLRSLDEKNC